jgi:hypothetical protein
VDLRRAVEVVLADPARAFAPRWWPECVVGQSNRHEGLARTAGLQPADQFVHGGLGVHPRQPNQALALLAAPSMRMDDDDVPAVTGTQAITRAQLYGVKPLAQILQAGGGLFRVIGAAAAPSTGTVADMRPSRMRITSTTSTARTGTRCTGITMTSTDRQRD